MNVNLSKISLSVFACRFQKSRVPADAILAPIKPPQGTFVRYCLSRSCLAASSPWADVGEDEEPARRFPLGLVGSLKFVSSRRGASPQGQALRCGRRPWMSNRSGLYLLQSRSVK